MTPAQKANLKVGDRILVTDTRSNLLGWTLELKTDDGSHNPWFWRIPKNTDGGSNPTPFSICNRTWQRAKTPQTEAPTPNTKQEYSFKALHPDAVDLCTVAENLTRENPIALVTSTRAGRKIPERIVIVHHSLATKASRTLPDDTPDCAADHYTTH